MKKHILIVLCPMILFFSCNEEKENIKEDIFNIGLDADKDVGVLDISYMLDSTAEVKIATLETSKNCLLSEQGIKRIYVDEDTIFIFDEESKGIYKFDINGKLISKIQNIGEGPYDYVKISDVFFDKNGIYILDYVSKKTLIYNRNCQFVRYFKKGDWYANSIFVSDNRICYMNDFSIFPKGNTYKLYSVDKYGKDLKGNIPFEKNESRGYHLMDNFNRYTFVNGEIKLLLPFNDTIFKYENGNMTPIYKLDFGNKWLPKDYNALSSNQMKENGFFEKYIISLRKLNETKNHLFIEYMYGKIEKGEKIKMPFYTLIIDKKTRNPIICNEINFKTATANTIFGNIYFTEDYIVYVMPSMFFNWVKDEDINCHYTGNTKDRYIDIKNKISSEDNPVLFIYRLKE